MKSKPDDRKALATAAGAAIQMGDLEKAAGYVKQLTALPFAGREEHRAMAWHALLSGKVEETLVGALQKDADPQGMNPDYFYLLGLLQAATGKAEDARRSLVSGLEVDEVSLTDAKPWMLMAKIQQQYGLPDAAAASMAAGEVVGGTTIGSDSPMQGSPAAAIPISLEMNA